jgi:hypothetical protein
MAANPPANGYMKTIDTTRKAVAIAMVIFAVGMVLCARRNDLELTTEARRSGAWAWATWAFVMGIYACAIATLALVLEYLARPARPWPFSLRWLFVRALLLLVVVAAITSSLYVAYGPGQAIGAAVGTLLLLAAVREHHIRRGVPAVLATVVLGLTVWGTQSPFQYARWHADEIVAAGCELAERCPRAGYHTYNRHPNFDPSGMFALFGQEISPSDPRVPEVLRKLGARRIWVDDERVAVYVGEEAEFQIHRDPHGKGRSSPVWGFQGKGSTRIADRLWTNGY